MTSVRNYPPREKTPPGESSGPPVEEEVQVLLDAGECEVLRVATLALGRSVWWIFYVAAQVEERLVGAVLGPAGRYVEEIKQYRCQ